MKKIVVSLILLAGAGVSFAAVPPASNTNITLRAQCPAPFNDNAVLQRGMPKGAFITKEFFEEFRGRDVTIAVKTFIRYNAKYKTKPTSRIPQGKISLHFEEMKLPPVGDDLVLKSATVIPFLTSAWQEKQASKDEDTQGDDGKLRYDGKHVINPEIVGGWKVVDQVKTIDEFTAGKKMNPGRPAFTALTFTDKGRTDQAYRIWSGEYLMDLDRYQALRMTLQRVCDDDYLFVEAGGFSERNKEDWKSPLLVMKRK
ncbi:MAG: hypothetical protein QGI24_04460 [Kiritimatiellia bacterium]|jgi:hypothetical protein|nr:hypothetical protein [Kiritimatiellia bacterium]MDP6848020.1 hypothetical protein [Kiritimatiellia bacterium]